MRRVTGLVLLAWAVAALTGCTLSFGGVEEQALPQFAGAPSVRITAPLPNATYLAGVAVNVQVQVTNAGSDIDRVEVSVDGALLGTLPQPNPASASAFGVTQTFVADDEGAHTIDAVAFRADGTASVPASVTINVVSELPSPEAATSEPTFTGLPQTATNTVMATSTNQLDATVTMSVNPTQPSTLPTTQGIVVSTQATISSQPTTAATPGQTGTLPVAKFEGIVNVRSGPSTNFEPPLGTFQAGQQTDIVAVNTDGTWLKVEFGTGTGWVFTQIVKVEGDISTLPREAGPAIPTPRPRTNTPVPPVQPTSAPNQPTSPPAASDGPNLVVVNWEISQLDGTVAINNVQTGKPAIAFVRVRNAGNQPSGGFFVVLTVVNTSDSQGKLVEAGSTGELAAGAEVVIQVGFTDNSPAGTGRTAVARIDENNQVPETNEGDNASGPISYTLLP